jgi:hypothetical protein
MHANERRNRAHLSCEQLESRSNPSAGNVSVFISGGELIEIADSHQDAVSTQITSTGHLVIYGVSGTTVNTMGMLDLGFFRPTSVLIEGGMGGDQIDVAGLNLAGNLTVIGGAGNDLITVRGVVANNISLFGEGGNDTFITTSVLARNNLLVNGGAGFDIWDHSGTFAGHAANFISVERVRNTG